jgi:N-acetylmuramoyl-L-alanine amidase
LSHLKLLLLLGTLASLCGQAWARSNVNDFLLRGGEVTLLLSEPAKFTWQREQLPDRLVVDLADCEIGSLSRQLIRSTTNWYDHVRVEKRTDSLHLVFYVRPGLRPEVLAESPATSLVISPGPGVTAPDTRPAAPRLKPTPASPPRVAPPAPVEPPSDGPDTPRAEPVDPSGARASIQRISILPPKDGVVDVVVELTRALRPVSFPLFSDPAKPRIVVDFPGASLEPREQQIDAPVKDLVTRVHTGLFEGKTPRVVLNLSQKAYYQQIVEDDPFRVILRVGGQGVPVSDTGSKPPRPVSPSMPEPEAPTVPMVAGSLRGSTVVLDPGHGGRDSGATHLGLREKDVTLDVAKRVALLLESAGVRVVMTRSDDRYITVGGRPQMANSLGADLFVSIHCNDTGGPRVWSGTETYFHYNSAIQKQFARIMQRHVVGSLGLPDRGIRSDGIRFPGMGFGVLRGARMPAVLVEIGYVNHPTDASRLSDPVYRQKAAEGVFEGLKAFREGSPTAVAATSVPASTTDSAVEETE